MVPVMLVFIVSTNYAISTLEQHDPYLVTHKTFRIQYPPLLPWQPSPPSPPAEPEAPGKDEKAHMGHVNLASYLGIIFLGLQV